MIPYKHMGETSVIIVVNLADRTVRNSTSQEPLLRMRCELYVALIDRLDLVGTSNNMFLVRRSSF